MATQTYFFEGSCKWAKVRKPDEMYDNYQIQWYPKDDAEWKKLLDSGIQLKQKEDEDGKYVTFKRRHQEFNYFKKEQQTNGPPEILLKKDKEYIPFPDGLIGNGSEVTCKVDVYDTRNGKGHRLITVAINKLVEYKGSETPASTEPKIKMPF